MGALDVQDRRTARTLRRELEELEPAASSGEFVATELCSLLRAERAVLNRPTLASEGWVTEFFFAYPRYSVGDVQLFERFLRGATRGTGTYDPLRPEPLQRNRVLVLNDVLPFANTDTRRLFGEVFPRLALDRRDQMRVLVCDGPHFLAWVGAFRPEPFRVREQRLLSGLVPSLGRRYRLEQSLRRAGVLEKGLAAALEAIGAPAFLIDSRGRIVLASESGLRLAGSDSAALCDRLRAACRAQTADSVATVRQPGVPLHRLIVLRAGQTEIGSQVARATRAWRLTPRQAEVLGCLAVGDANKTIAEKLGCSVATVEVHVSAVLTKAGALSRAAVAAALWRDLT